jgi:hypothetical protein
VNITRQDMLDGLDRSGSAGIWRVELESGDRAYDPETGDTLLGPAIVIYRFDLSGRVPGAGPYTAQVDAL